MLRCAIGGDVAFAIFSSISSRSEKNCRSASIHARKYYLRGRVFRYLISFPLETKRFPFDIRFSCIYVAACPPNAFIRLHVEHNPCMRQEIYVEISALCMARNVSGFSSPGYVCTKKYFPMCVRRIWIFRLRRRFSFDSTS